MFGGSEGLSVGRSRLGWGSRVARASPGSVKGRAGCALPASSYAPGWFCAPAGAAMIRDDPCGRRSRWHQPASPLGVWSSIHCEGSAPRSLPPTHDRGRHRARAGRRDRVAGRAARSGQGWRRGRGFAPAGQCDRRGRASAARSRRRRSRPALLVGRDRRPSRRDPCQRVAALRRPRGATRSGNAGPRLTRSSVVTAATPAGRSASSARSPLALRPVTRRVSVRGGAGA